MLSLDDAQLLVIADQLTERSHPLGEYLVLRVQHSGAAKVPETKRRRMRSLELQFQRTLGAKTKFVDWQRWGLTLNFQDVPSVLKHTAELKGTLLPLVIDVGDGSRSRERCFFDPHFSLLAWMNSEVSVTNQNHSPGMDEEWHHWRDVKVWRVAGGELVFTKGFSAEWSALEFRADGLHAMNRTSAVERLWHDG